MCSLRSVVLHANPWRNARTHYSSCDDDAVIIKDFYPVVVRNSHRLGFFIIHPQGINSAGKRGHSLVVTVCGMDVPLTVRCQVVEHDDRTSLLSIFRKLQIGILSGEWLRFVGWKVLTEINVDWMIEIQSLPPSQGSPWNERFHGVCKRRIRPSVPTTSGC